MKNLIVGFMVLGLFFVGMVVGNSLQGDIVGCLYGNCKKDGFVIRDLGEGNELGKGKQFWVGFTKYKGKTTSSQDGVSVNTGAKIFTYYSGNPRNRIIQMKGDRFRLGNYGFKNGWLVPCEGVEFSLSSSEYSKFKDSDCQVPKVEVTK